MFKRMIELVRKAQHDAVLAEQVYDEQDFRREMRNDPALALGRFTQGADLSLLR